MLCFHCSDPYPRRAPSLVNPYERDPYDREILGREPPLRDPLARSAGGVDPYERAGIARDPLARDPLAREPALLREPVLDPLAREPYERAPLLRQPYGNSPMAAPEVIDYSLGFDFNDYKVHQVMAFYQKLQQILSLSVVQ